MINKPVQISESEWKEIMAIPSVRDSWGIEEDETPDDFAANVYGVKFDFMSGSPGYRGDLHIIQSDTLGNEPPVLIIRRDSGLEVVSD